MLHRLAGLLARDQEALATVIALEAGKPLRAARAEVERAIGVVRLSAAVAATLTGQLVPADTTAAGAGRVSFAQRVPRGIVAAITPFNFPLNLVTHKIAPALAVGCPVVLKPADRTPLTALRLASLAAEAGLPQGWLHMVCGGPATGAALVVDPRVAVISFTGSGSVGRRIQQAAVGRRVLLELGSNAAAIVAADADLDLAADRIVAGGYGYAGQSCVSVQRVLVDRRVHADLLDRLRDGAQRLVVGDPLEERTDVGPLITPEAAHRVHDRVADAVAAGARLITGGERSGPRLSCLAPALLDDVAVDIALWREEAFGPVVAVRAVASVDEAARLANATDLRLHAGVFTADLVTALDLVERLDFGGVNVNDAPTFRADAQPYGGVAGAGNTRESPEATALELTDFKTVTIARA